MSIVPRLALALVFLSCPSAQAEAGPPRPIHGGLTVDFPYRDRVLLKKGRARGGRVWVPSEAMNRGGVFPVVVLLHGVVTRYEHGMHRLLPRYQNLSRVAAAMIRSRRVEPVILAAPSQTKRATFSGTLWTEQGFDLADFVRTVEQVLSARAPGVQVDRARVSVFGHSGAGCGFGGKGLFRIAKQVPSLRRAGFSIPVLGLMDVCFNGKRGGRLLRENLAGTRTRVFAMWVEPEQWGSANYRQIRRFAGALGEGVSVECDRRRYSRCRRFGRRFRLVKARRRALVRAFRDRRFTGTYLPPHSTLPLWFMEEAFRLYLFRPFVLPRFLDRFMVRFGDRFVFDFWRMLNSTRRLRARASLVERLSFFRLRP